MLYVLDYFNKKNCTFDLLVWCKTNPIPKTNGTWLPDIEYCLFFKEKGSPRLNDGYELKHKFYVSQINIEDKKKFLHPTIKPLEMVEKHILHSTQPNDIVLDCFMGSGTTCVAAKNTGRRYIGIDINQEYVKIANDRLNNIDQKGNISLF